jgi:hypothetical protein
VAVVAGVPAVRLAAGALVPDQRERSVSIMRGHQVRV